MNLLGAILCAIYLRAPATWDWTPSTGTLDGYLVEVTRDVDSPFIALVDTPEYTFTPRYGDVLTLRVRAYRGGVRLGNWFLTQPDVWSDWSPTSDPACVVRRLP